MSVEIDPVELGFRRPFQTEVSQILRLRNPHQDPVAFKVKTTAPKQYCVRPNSGRIEPGDEVQVQVLLQAMKEDPPLDAKCRDKFLVQSVAITADMEYTSVAQIWSHIEQTNKSAIQEKKIRVIFLPAEGSVSASSPQSTKTNGASFLSEQRSPSPEAVTPQRASTAQPVGAVSRPESRPADNRHLGDAVNSAHNPSTASSAMSSATTAIANSVPTSADDVKAQLAEAQAQISKLTQQLQGQGLRQRKPETDSSNTKGEAPTSLGVLQPPATGVPVQVVAGLCLLSFLLAYFLF